MMRAKFKITSVEKYAHECEVLNFSAVSRSDSYPEDGSDENNTYAMYTPSANLKMTVNNPALIGKFEPGQEFYVDFTPVN